MVALICMVGNDYQRILDGINFWRSEELIEAIYLFFDYKQDKYGYASQKNVEDLENSLMLKGTQPLNLGYNPQSFENVFSTFYKILKKEVDIYQRGVLIDATSTTKEAYGATVTIALMFRNVRLYIVPPKERGWYVPTPQDKNFQEWFRKTRSIQGMQPQEIYLPGQRLRQPVKDEIIVLLKLYEHQGTSDKMIDIIKWCRRDPNDPVIKNKFSRIISRLENKGFVEKETTNRSKKVSLTRFGQILTEAIIASRSVI